MDEGLVTVFPTIVCTHYRITRTDPKLMASSGDMSCGDIVEQKTNHLFNANNNNR
jgi:hypothetical protein